MSGSERPGVLRGGLAECVGSALIVVSFGLAAGEPGAGVLTPLAAGAATAAAMAGTHGVSGGHCNPALSLAAWLRGAITVGRLLVYVAAQALGAWAGGWLVVFLNGQGEPMVPGLRRMLLAEAFFCFGICWVFLGSTRWREPLTDGRAAVPVGLLIAAGGLAAGGISGGVFNPAAALGLAGAGLLPWSMLPGYAIAGAGAAVVAAAVSLLVRGRA